MDLASIVNNIFGGLTVLAQVLLLWFLVSWLFGKESSSATSFFRSNGVVIAFVASALAMLGSLTYSEILGYEPCKLCWIQRILMYPQVLILGMALWSKHRGNRALIDLSFVLSIIGACVAAYHYLLQLGVAPAIPCSAIGYSASCSQRFVLQFGYITIPLMAFSAFLLIIVSLYTIRKQHPTS